MNSQEEFGPKAKNLREIESVITKAIKRINGKKENDLCKYLPMTGGGYMHHFTLKKMKNRQPKELSSIIEKFIINTEKPSKIAPKQRIPRSFSKKRGQVALTPNQLERMLTIARLAGDKEMVAVLAPRKSLPACKRELIASIRHCKVDQELWNAYVEAVNQTHVQQATIAVPLKESSGSLLGMR